MYRLRGHDLPAPSGDPTPRGQDDGPDLLFRCAVPRHELTHNGIGQQFRQAGLATIWHWRLRFIPTTTHYAIYVTWLWQRWPHE
jgi:hypothetical protein